MSEEEDTDDHRLDYGSVRTEWSDPSVGNDPQPVKVRINCACGTRFCGEGASFSDANRDAHEQFDRHLAFVREHAEPDDTFYGEC